MAPLLELARERNIALVEDAAQTQGARQAGRVAGGFGAISATSFYPGKNLGAFGDAGAVLTHSTELANTVRALRNYGSETKYHHPEVGFNSRLDAIQAVVLRAKLRHLTRWNQARRNAAARYDSLLETLPIQRPLCAPDNEHIWHLYVIQVDSRDSVLQALRAEGIGAGIHYPIPCHLQGALSSLGYQKGDFPVTEAAANRILSLPLYPEISPDQQKRVAQALSAALA